MNATATTARASIFLARPVAHAAFNLLAGSTKMCQWRCSVIHEGGGGNGEKGKRSKTNTTVAYLRTPPSSPRRTFIGMLMRGDKKAKRGGAGNRDGDPRLKQQVQMRFFGVTADGGGAESKAEC